MSALGVQASCQCATCDLLTVLNYVHDNFPPQYVNSAFGYNRQFSQKVFWKLTHPSTFCSVLKWRSVINWHLHLQNTSVLLTRHNTQPTRECPQPTHFYLCVMAVTSFLLHTTGLKRWSRDKKYGDLEAERGQQMPCIPHWHKAVWWRVSLAMLWNWRDSLWLGYQNP